METNPKRGGRRPGSGAKPSTFSGLLRRVSTRHAKKLRREVRLFALKVLANLASNPSLRKAVEIALLAEAKSARTRPVRHVTDTQPCRSGRGGSRPGAGAKPTTIQGLLSRLPATRANRLRADISAAVLGEVKAIVREVAPGRARRSGRKPKDELADTVTLLKSDGYSWAEITRKLNLEARSLGQEPKTEDAYRSLYRSRQKKLAKSGRGGRRQGAGRKRGSRGTVVEIPPTILTTPG